MKMMAMKIQLIVLYVNQQLNTFAQFVRKRFVWFSAVNRIQIPLMSSVEYTKPMIQDVPLWNLNVIYVKKMRRACLIVIWLTTVKLHIRICLRYRKLMTAHGNMYLVTDVKKSRLIASHKNMQSFSLWSMCLFLFWYTRFEPTYSGDSSPKFIPEKEKTKS